MNAKTNINKEEFYTTKKYKVELLNKLKGDNNYINERIDILKDDLRKGFSLYTRRNLERFIQCANDIDDFANQFVKLDIYYKNNNKYANSEDLFKILYGENLGAKKWIEKISKVQGENNVWYNHGGKFSPFKKGSVNYSEDAIEKAKNNRSYTTQIEYYIDKGMSLSQAKDALSKRQSTFSLEICIKKYGKEEGTKRWKERQVKWQNTLNSKSQEEIDDINRRKSSGIGRCLDRNIPGKLYYIRFYNDEIEFWKIGITSLTVSRRFNLSSFTHKYGLNYNIEFINKYDTIEEAYEKEQYILQSFNNKRITVNMNGFKTTETFSENVLKGFYETV